MIQTLLLVSDENLKRFNSFDGNFGSNSDKDEDHNKILESLTRRLDEKGGLSQEEFLVWAVEENGLVEPLLELLFQVCHVSFVLRPHCRHHEHDIGEF